MQESIKTTKIYYESTRNEPTSVKNPSRNLSHLEIGIQKPENGDWRPENGAQMASSGAGTPRRWSPRVHFTGYPEGPGGPIY